jgi:biotin operon repressor
VIAVMKSIGQSLRRSLVGAAATRRIAPARSGAEPYLSIDATHALLAGSLAGRTARLAQADMISTEEAALLNGTSRVTVNAWIDKGRAIGLTQNKRGYRMPKWQFEPLLWEALPPLSAALGTK